MKTALFLFLASRLFAALPAGTVVWEVRPTVGADTNGGGFITGATGTDMSQFNNENSAGCSNCQSATVNLSTTDAVGNGTTTIASATANFSAAVVGNVVRLSGGTGALAIGWYQVVSFTTSTAVVVDRAVAAGTGISLDIGGALSTHTQLSTNLALAAGSGAWVKNTGTFPIATTYRPAAGGTNTGFYFLNGYSTTRGDTGKFTFVAQAGLSGGNNSVLAFNTVPNGFVLRNAIVDCANLNFTRGINVNGTGVRLVNIIVQNCSDDAFAFNTASASCEQCTTFNVPSSTAAASSNSAWLNGNANFTCTNCEALGSTKASAVAFDSWCTQTTIGLVAAHFTGAGATGMFCGTQESQLIMLNSVFYDINGDAIRFNEGNVDTRPLLIRNTVISNVTGFCFNHASGTVLPAGMFSVEYNACKVTGSAGFYNNWPTNGTGDVVLTVDPFVNGATNNFALNSTAGGGAAVKAVGFPGALPNGGGTGFLDMGALQSAAGGGTTGGGSAVYQ